MMASSKNKLGNIWLIMEGELVPKTSRKYFEAKSFVCISIPWQSFSMGANISNKEYNFFIISETDEWQCFSALLFSNVLQLS